MRRIVAVLAIVVCLTACGQTEQQRRSGEATSGDVLFGMFVLLPAAAVANAYHGVASDLQNAAASKTPVIEERMAPYVTALRSTPESRSMTIVNWIDEDRLRVTGEFTDNALKNTPDHGCRAIRSTPTATPVWQCAGIWDMRSRTFSIVNERVAETDPYGKPRVFNTRPPFTRGKEDEQFTERWGISPAEWKRHYKFKYGGIDYYAPGLVARTSHGLITRGIVGKGEEDIARYPYQQRVWYFVQSGANVVLVLGNVPPTGVFSDSVMSPSGCRLAIHAGGPVYVDVCAAAAAGALTPQVQAQN